MQAVGGVRGGLLSTWLQLYQQTNQEMALVEYPDPDYLFIQANRPDITPIVHSSTAGLNIRDVILPNHLEDGLPAQYVLENADCRLFYTREMILDVTNIWNAAATAAFNGGKCVTGSLTKRGVKDSTKKTRQVLHGPKSRRGNNKVEFTRETVVKDGAWRMRHGQKALE